MGAREEPAASLGDVRPSFLSSAAVTYGSYVGAATLSLGNVLITARALGPGGRGAVAFLTTIAWLTSQLATLGIHQANANLAGRHPELTARLAANSVVLSAAFGAAAAGIVAAIVAAFPSAGGSASSGLLAAVLVSIPMLVLQTSLIQIVQARYGFRISAAAWLAAPVVNVSVNGGLALVDALSVTAAVLTWIGGQLLATLLLAWWVIRRLEGFGSPDGELGRRMLAFGLRTHGGRIMLVGNYRLDQWLLGGIAGDRALGLYSVAVAWSEVLFFLPSTLAAVQRPDLVRASGAAARREASAVFRAALALTLVAAAVVALLAPFLCVTLFGDPFEGSVQQLRILAAGAFGITALKLLGNALTAQRRPLLETAAVGASFVTLVALDLILIPAHEGTGAAIASTAAYSLGGIVAVVVFLRALRGRPGELVPRASDVGALVRRLRRPARAAPVE
jgi:O-antigen/teichoic acid export membrane protein